MKIQTAPTPVQPEPRPHHGPLHTPTETYHKNLLGYGGGAGALLTALAIYSPHICGEVGPVAALMGGGFGAFSGAVSGMLREYSNDEPNDRVTPMVKQGAVGALIGGAASVGGAYLTSLIHCPMLGTVAGLALGMVGAAAFDSGCLDRKDHPV